MILPWGGENGLLLPASSSWMSVLVLVGDFILGCSTALAASTPCWVTVRRFPPHFSVFASFGIEGGRLRFPAPSFPTFGPHAGFDTPDRTSSAVSRAVQDVWDVKRDDLGTVPPDVVLALRDAVSRSNVDDFWSIWSKSAEAGLFRAYALAGGPTAAGSSAFLGRGLLRIRSWRLGGRTVDGRGSSGLYRAGQGDEIDVHCSQYFVVLPLAPVVLFRRRLESVGDVLKGIRNNGDAVCRHGSFGPICSLDPWDWWGSSWFAWFL